MKGEYCGVKPNKNFITIRDNEKNKRFINRSSHNA